MSSYQIIGQDDTTATVRMFLGEKGEVVDEIMPLPEVPTLEQLMDQIVQTRIHTLEKERNI